MYEDPNCVDCMLHRGCKTVCLPSRGPVDCKLAIYLDHPDLIEDRRSKSMVGDKAGFVDFCLRRMGIDPATIYMDYILKCYSPKLPSQKGLRMQCVSACGQYRIGSLEDMSNLRALVGLGSLCCEVFTGDKHVSNRQGAEWNLVSPVMRQFVPHVWIGFSPGILREQPSEAGSIYRVIWKAAEEAGLNPTVTKIPLYEWDV